MKLLTALLLLGLRGYRLIVSPVLTSLGGPWGFGCRFTPTCSRYATEALQTHGPLKGGSLALRRFCRCHPWGESGSDPVPPVSSLSERSKTDAPRSTRLSPT